MDQNGIAYLIPSLLDENGIDAIPSYVPAAVKNCSVFFVENERTTRRYLKQIWKVYLPGQELIIDEFEWYVIDKAEEALQKNFVIKLKEGKNIRIISVARLPMR